jgi:hypothetical protein
MARNCYLAGSNAGSRGQGAPAFAEASAGNAGQAASSEALAKEDGTEPRAKTDKMETLMYLIINNVSTTINRIDLIKKINIFDL